MTQPICVGKYLTTRLEQLRVTHIFSVPGDFTSELLEIIDEDSKIERIGNCNELNAGYAADGYARTNGLGVVCVTSGVGAFSLLNAVAGSFAEMIPVVVIIGTLSNTSRLKEVNAGRRFHHQVSVADKNQTIYENVTISCECISNPLTAPEQIDRALQACISHSLPVLIEITEDCYKMPCHAPVGQLERVPLYIPLSELRDMKKNNKYAAQIANAVEDATKKSFVKLKSAKKPLFWIGHEISRYNLHEPVKKLLKLTGLPFVTSLLGKSVLGEDTPGFVGVYEGVFISPKARPYTENSDCIFALGVWNTDINTLGIETYETGNPASVFASRNVVKVGLDLYVQVSLENFINSLIECAENDPISKENLVYPILKQPEVPEGRITFDGFMAELNSYLKTDNIVVADIGISANGNSAFLTINRQEGYHIQALWASIGWSVPAGLGASFVSGSRTIVIVGDGAFKLTCQEIATMVRYNRNTVVFVMNNGVYAVEQMFLDPAPFKSDSTPFEAANVLQRWDYGGLMNGFSNGEEAHGKSAKVTTQTELKQTLRDIDKHPDTCWLVDIYLDERDYPKAWNAIVNKKQS
jgi:indolepyruvate decarboxylase